ncbi:MAG: FAA hydrolase family protein [Alphaproteobacteria bacterium]|nr:MAG: FAA hydrolase family protein [Alphaproteobacteria bacterium]
MKLLRYGPEGSEKPGLLDRAGNIRDLSGHVSDLAGDALLPASIQGLQALDPDSLPLVDGNPRIGPCVAGTGKFMGIGLNYADHAAETGAELPTEPMLFMKATSCICGPNDDVIIPRGSTQLDWEVELAVVIGQGGKYIAEADAINHVAGYCVVNDVSERSYQFDHSGQFTKGKSADHFGPIGPWLVTPDEVSDPQNMRLWLNHNGEKRQDGSTREMVFGALYLVSYLSHYMRLEPGDIITTGTPPGVGRGMTPPVYLREGDILHLGVDGLGEQRQNVVADT